MDKSDIDRPGPGTLPPRISFVEQMGGSAGYYVRFQDIPEEEGGPVQKYVPILQFDSQEEALEAAIQFRNETAREHGVDPEPTYGNQGHSDQAREKMSDSHNRTGLRGLGLSLSNSKGTLYPVLRALWSEEGGQQKVTRSTVQRGIWNSVEELVPHLKEHIHEGIPEEELLRRGAEGVAQCLQEVCRSAPPKSSKRKRLESLFEKWARQNSEDRQLLGQGDLSR
jgi:hypothetical protein